MSSTLKVLRFVFTGFRRSNRRSTGGQIGGKRRLDRRHMGGPTSAAGDYGGQTRDSTPVRPAASTRSDRQINLGQTDFRRFRGPYLAIDSTFLIGKFKGQLAVVCAIDGHNWMHPVACGIFDSETNENWIWFMQQLRDAIGTPTGLAICTDAGKGVDNAVNEVFSSAEHRECMKHLVTNFKKKFFGKRFFEKHIAAMQKAKPEAMSYLKKYHKRLWSRSQFSTVCKVDYVTNNLAKSFNNMVKDWKGLHLYDFLEKIRRWMMVKWDKRRRICMKFEGRILPHIVKELNEKSRDLDMVVTRNGDFEAEVEVKGVSMAKANHGFFLAPPILKRSAGRPKTMRYKGCTEKGSKRSGRHKCPICKTYGHHWNNCKEGDPEQLAAMLAER
uniref:Transposon protein, putative, Mutator sub-class n=2 Tax=Oryza sativa subsp. japonica TaxID=39947 RepID=Q53JN6_ORYSJ|nr:hypothetical protein [Oryza sativa Japonica Group]ABA93284.1 transposon protein, putative, Mutator sub-class [Oryza sativa Japonica Group]